MTIDASLVPACLVLEFKTTSLMTIDKPYQLLRRTSPQPKAQCVLTPHTTHLHTHVHMHPLTHTCIHIHLLLLRLNRS